MTRRRRFKPIQGLFKGALKWYFLMAIVFVAFFFEATLQLQIFRNDYETADLTREIKETVQRINQLQSKEAELAAMGRLNSKVPDLGLVQPEPHQMQVVFPRPVPTNFGNSQPYNIASLNPAPITAKTGNTER